MKLSELVKSKKKENGLKWADFQEAGIGAQTYNNILHDKQKSMKPATMEKLAHVLKCSMGEIQACMAEVPNPLREEAERQEGIHKQSVMATVDKLEQMVAEVYSEPEPPKKVPVKKKWYPDQPAVSVPEPDPEETLAEFKARMKDMCLRKFAEYKDSDEAKIFIAEAVLEELLK